MATYRQGDTLSCTMELSEPLGDNLLKVGIYSQYGGALYETVYPDDGEIVEIDSTHYALTIQHLVTRNFVGPLNMRLVVFAADLSMVNAGETSIPMTWEAEPANKNLNC